MAQPPACVAACARLWEKILRQRPLQEASFDPWNGPRDGHYRKPDYQLPAKRRRLISRAMPWSRGHRCWSALTACSLPAGPAAGTGTAIGLPVFASADYLMDRVFAANVSAADRNPSSRPLRTLA